jgi:hypothetical protein
VIKNDKEVVMEAVKQQVNSNMPVKLKNNKDAVMEAVKKDGKSLQYSCNELRNNKEVVY